MEKEYNLIDLYLKDIQKYELLNREEEYEVIPMLNKVLDELGTLKVSALHKLEDMIENDLPGNVRSRENVFDWLVKNY